MSGLDPSPEVAQKSLAKRSWTAELYFLWQPEGHQYDHNVQRLYRQHPHIEMNGPMFGGLGGVSPQINGGDPEAMAAAKNVGPTPDTDPQNGTDRTWSGAMPVGAL